MHGYMYEDRGEMMSTFIVCFGLSSIVAGFSSGAFYKYEHFVLTFIFLTFILFAGNTLLPHVLNKSPNGNVQ
jgi:hypothetical protein